ncbi:helix-turn-helix transcriptional regulator [Cuspidothrix issatschenkoi LEGE 03284]|uniref:helix-turn-helix domain-containing protein n=1 Tax=Cuspidothrix issatschenkoi TaxID=230752 RepID=UPI00187F2143|nr:helix-turn-helix transcriptional regulator [Cuspidothrix issatschenkoi]MBE9231551.1 helix-turn-helix transcriptional regulator [Cuspidothrix issatschenkoi LEGE 03284]
MTENSQLQKLGEYIRTIRKAQALSQEQLAELSGLHRNYIGGVERGERNVALLNIIRIAHALGMSPSELLTGLD